MYQQAITRGVSAKLNDCYLEYKQPELIDIGAARHQHDAYVATLQDLGLKVTVLPEDDDLPDCCFVEDSAVVTESFALITNMGTSERNGEREVVAEFLTRDLKGIRMQPPAQLEGGDVLRIGRTLYVGLSSRTNREGINFLRHISSDHGYTVVETPVVGALHLKTAVTYAGKGVVVCSAAMRPIMENLLEGMDIFVPPLTEEGGANVLNVNDTTVIPAGYPHVAEALMVRGLTLRELDISEFEKAEAGLTCMSILF